MEYSDFMKKAFCESGRQLAIVHLKGKYTHVEFEKYFGILPSCPTCVDFDGRFYIATPLKRTIKLKFVGLLEAKKACRLPQATAVASAAYFETVALDVSTTAENVRAQKEIYDRRKSWTEKELLAPLLDFAKEYLSPAAIAYESTVSVTNFGCSAYLFVGFLDDKGAFVKVAKIRCSDHGCGDRRIFEEIHFNKDMDLSELAQKLKRMVDARNFC